MRRTAWRLRLGRYSETWKREKMKIRQPADATLNDGKVQRNGVEQTKDILRTCDVMVVREERIIRRARAGNRM